MGAKAKLKRRQAEAKQKEREFREEVITDEEEDIRISLGKRGRKTPEKERKEKETEQVQEQEQQEQRRENDNDYDFPRDRNSGKEKETRKETPQKKTAQTPTPKKGRKAETPENRAPNRSEMVAMVLEQLAKEGIVPSEGGPPDDDDDPNEDDDESSSSSDSENESNEEDEDEESNDEEDELNPEQLMRTAVQSLVKSQGGIAKSLQLLQARCDPKPRDKGVDYKITLATYSGNSTDNLDLFLWSLETMFEAKAVPEHLKVVTTIANLRGKALLHIQSLGEKCRKYSWEEFVDHLKATFGPRLEEENLLERLTKLEQKRDLITYLTEFRTIMNKMEELPAKYQLLYFTRGLKKRTQAELRIKQPATLEDAIHFATVYEAAAFADQKWVPKSEYKKSSNSNSNSGDSNNNNSNNNKGGNSGYKGKQKWKKKNNSQTNQSVKDTDQKDKASEGTQPKYKKKDNQKSGKSQGKGQPQTESFDGNCHFCKIYGHRKDQCNKLKEKIAREANNAEEEEEQPSRKDKKKTQN